MDEEDNLVSKEGGDDKKSDKNDEDDDSHCFPYYDWIRSIYRRFDGSFVTILMIENFNFGLWTMV